MKFSNVFNNLKEAIKEGVIIRKPAVKSVKESTRKAVIRVNGKIVSEHTEVNQEVIRDGETIQAETVVTAKKAVKKASLKKVFTVLTGVFNWSIVILIYLLCHKVLATILIASVLNTLVTMAYVKVCKRNNWF